MLILCCYNSNMIIITLHVELYIHTEIRMYNIIKLSVHHDDVCCSCSDPVLLHPYYRHSVFGGTAPKRHYDNNISYASSAATQIIPLWVQNNRCIPTIRAGHRPTGATTAVWVQQGSHRIGEGEFYTVYLYIVIK